jgi:hypothetical protein
MKNLAVNYSASPCHRKARTAVEAAHTALLNHEAETTTTETTSESTANKGIARMRSAVGNNRRSLAFSQLSFTWPLTAVKYQTAADRLQYVNFKNWQVSSNGYHPQSWLAYR